MAKDRDDSPEIWEDWDDEWSNDYIKSSGAFEDEDHEDHGKIASRGADYYKMFLSVEE